MKRFIFSLFCCVISLGQIMPEVPLEQKLMSRIRAYDQGINGVVGVAIIDLENQHILQYNGETVFPQASSIKIPIMAEVFRAARAGRVNLEETVTLDKRDSVEGSGHIRMLLRSRSVTLTVRELVAAMIETSDNTATNKLIAMVGMDAVNKMLAEMGFSRTRLNRRMLDSKAAEENRENVSTPIEMARLMEALYRGKVCDAEASKEMIAILKGVSADFRAGIPGAIPVASKPGQVLGVRAETGIIFLAKRPFVLSVMSTYLDAETNPIPTVTKMVYDHFEKMITSNIYGHKLQ
jgi:beta-lactamase class A